MPGITRVNADSAGGEIFEVLASSIYVNGCNVAVLNAHIVGHGVSPHSGPMMIEASPDVYAEGKKVCRQGDAASCGHEATGSSNVFANG